jgi:hypothetical protein
MSTTALVLVALGAFFSGAFVALWINTLCDAATRCDPEQRERRKLIHKLSNVQRYEKASLSQLRWLHGNMQRFDL